MTKRTGSRARIRRPGATLLVLAATAALVLAAVAGPSLAKAPAGKAKVRPFVCKAEVVGGNVAANTLTAKVVKGKKAVIGQTLTFTLSARARIVKLGADGAELIGLGLVAPGDRVLIHGRVDLSVAGAPAYTAWLVLDRGPAPLK